MMRELPQVRRTLSRLGRDRRGVAAVEFAIVGSTFFLLLMLALEFGMILFTQTTLDNATLAASRLILTGQIQTSGGSQTPFTTAICNDISRLVPCSKLQVEVQSASGFAALTPAETNGSGLTNTGFTPGGPGADVLVQVAYPRPFLIPWVGQALGLGNSFTLVSTAAFQNEPY